VAIAVAIAASARAGDDDDDLAAGDGTRSAAPIAGAVLVARDATWQVQWATAPALTVAFGPSALAALDRVRGGPAAPPLWGPSDAGPPVGWPFAVDGDVGGRLAIDGGVLPRPAPDGRIAAAWAVTRFTLDAGAADTRALRVLELRVRYRDGLAAWLNGVPIARRELTAAAPALAIATRPHGPEWESFFVPVAPGLLHAGTNVLAIEARPAAHGAAPALEVELAGRPQARVVRGPMVQRVGADRATIVLETDLPTVATVAWGQAALDHALPATAAARRHELALTGLPADALVRYQVTVDGAPIAAAAFATTPAAGEVVRIGVYGDVRGGHRVHAQLVERLVAEAPDLVVASGDLVLRGTDDADWQQFFAVTAPLLATVPVLPGGRQPRPRAHRRSGPTRDRSVRAGRRGPPIGRPARAGTASTSPTSTW
jgi:hypothetical protein